MLADLRVVEDQNSLVSNPLNIHFANSRSVCR
jgi:hypothetical protein